MNLLSKFCLFVVAALIAFGANRAAFAESDTCVRGRVTFEGTAPQVRKLLMNKNPEVCGHGYREMRDVQVDEHGGLADVVVYLDSTDLEFTWNHPEQGYVLTQEGCRFEPYVQIFPRDPRARLRIVNNDATLHNVRISQVLGRVKPTLLNLSQPSGGTPKEKPLRLKKGSHVVEIKCDAHDFMEGWIFAADNPYAALVSPDGSFLIEGVPPGEHTLSAWHPTLGTVSQSVVVGEGASTESNFRFSNKVSE